MPACLHDVRILALQAIQQPRPNTTDTSAPAPSPPLTDNPPPGAVAPGTAELQAARAALSAALPVLRESAQGGPYGQRPRVSAAGPVALPREYQVATL